MANKTIEKGTLEQRVDQLKSGVNLIHDEALHATEKVVDLSLASGEKWQKLMTKVLHTGTDLIEKQTDFAFNTLEEVKDQYLAGNKRFIKLIGLDLSKIRKAASLRGRKDNLKEIQGIGPKVESLLNKAGITSFDELANSSIESLQSVLQDAGASYQSMDPAPWIQLAQEAVIKRNNK